MSKNEILVKLTQEQADDLFGLSRNLEISKPQVIRQALNMAIKHIRLVEPYIFASKENPK